MGYASSISPTTDPMLYSRTMISIASINMEGDRHLDTVFGFIGTRKPHCLALQEAPAGVVDKLVRLGYFVSFVPMTYEASVAPGDTLGVIIATIAPATFTTHYYSAKYGTPTPFNPQDQHTKAYPIVHATLTVDSQRVTIGTTHLLDTFDGLANADQTACVEALLAYTKTLPPHILIGDFNMPRGYNTNYERFLAAGYTDHVPQSYTSSLDRTLHRKGNATDLNAPIFDIYMVDYLFGMAPYSVTDVTLTFGVSDHAALSATITSIV